MSILIFLCKLKLQQVCDINRGKNLSVCYINAVEMLCLSLNTFFPSDYCYKGNFTDLNTKTVCWSRVAQQLVGDYIYIYIYFLIVTTFCRKLGLQFLYLNLLLKCSKGVTKLSKGNESLISYPCSQV